MPPDPRRARELFHARLELPAAERAAFLAGACGSDAGLLARVRALLAADADPTDLTAPHAEPTADGGPGAAADTVIAGRYKLVEPIGEGGMGSVWLAQQSEPVKRKVAVKLIKAGMDSKAVLARFEAERQALALMDHPNIAKVLDGGLHDGRPFFVMELVKGVPITEYCDRRKLTPRERLELFVPVCQAIQHAHMKGVIHRDVKPSNVLIALYDDVPVPKIIDFGVAKATGAQLTDHTINTGFGGVVGTPQYMSPEQATLNNLDIDTRSDVYSLGALLYELLAGSPPFKRDELDRAGLLEVLRVVREEEPPRPSAKLSTATAAAALSASRGTDPGRLAGLLRSELDWIVMKALEKDRARRYDTAAGFAADVGRYLAGEPVQAHPPGAGYRLRKFLRKHRGPTIAAGLVAAALVLGLAGTAWQAVRAEREADRARDAEQTARDQQRAAEHTAASLAVDLDLNELQNDKPVGLLRLARRHGQIPADLTALREFTATSALSAGQEFAPLLPPPRTPDGTNPGNLTISPDGRLVLSFPDSHWQQPARVWDVRTGHVRTLRQADEVCDAGWADGGRTVYTDALDGAVRFWDAATGALKVATEPRPHRHHPSRGNSRSDKICEVVGRRLLTFGHWHVEIEAERGMWYTGRHRPVELWDTVSGRLVRRIDVPPGAPHAKFVGDRWVAAGSSGPSSCWFYSATTGDRVAQLPDVNVQQVFVNQAGTRLATWISDKNSRYIQEWDTATWKPTTETIHFDSGVPIGYLSDDAVAATTFRVIDDTAYHVFNIRRQVRLTRSPGGKPRLLPGGLFEQDCQVIDIDAVHQLQKPAGRRYNPELARGAVSGRYYNSVDPDRPVEPYRLIDLTTEKLIPDLVRADCHLSGLGFIGVSSSGVVFTPTSAPPIPPAALELWTQVAVRGELGPDGEFSKWDEPTWERKWRELAAVEPPRADFPFPGHLAADRLHWLRKEFDAAESEADALRHARELLRRSEAAGDGPEAARWRREVDKRVPELAPPPRPVSP